MQAKEPILIMAVVAAMVVHGVGMRAAATTVSVADGSITTGTGTYASTYQLLDTTASPFSPDRWDITASDLTFEGQINISDINAKARWNTWDDNTGDATDKLGAWYMWGPYAGAGKGVWMTGVQWTGGGDTANDIREIFHMQDQQGTQPAPTWHTGPYTGSGWEWLDDWFNFKLVVHATSNTIGSAQMWIHDELVDGGGTDTFNFDITGATDDLTNMRLIMWMINGNNPNNPDYTLSWRNAQITGTAVVPLPAGTWMGFGFALLLGGTGGLNVLRRRRSCAGLTE